ncbi:hypothetical protein J4714_14260 [Staphylococcus epidermidis]|nr:hypothetical protein [Staphylococcus epidermidis]
MFTTLITRNKSAEPSMLAMNREAHSVGYSMISLKWYEIKIGSVLFASVIRANEETTELPEDSHPCYVALQHALVDCKSTEDNCINQQEQDSMAIDFQGRVAIVTGAGGGLGRLCAGAGAAEPRWWSTIWVVRSMARAARPQPRKRWSMKSVRRAVRRWPMPLR